jgi:murein DD-endopeptidase MepM/ murein hydrolase activator NlpD
MTVKKMRRPIAVACAALIALAAPAIAAEPPAPLTAEALHLEGTPAQGALVRGTAPPGARIWLDGKPVQVDPDGAFVIGFGRDAAALAALEVALPGAPRQAIALPVVRRDWPVQRIDGLPPAQVTPDATALARIRAEQKELDAARAADSAEQGFRGPFRWPASGPISGVYGSQRILNGEPRAPHVGLDIAAPEGAPVQAPAAGVVRLAAPELFFTGGTVILDHGHGVMTLYAHLSAIDVRPGQRVAAGDPVGRVGKTGRVTGPHLHLALYWRGVALDPAGVLPPGPPPESPAKPPAKSPQGSPVGPAGGD